MLLPLVALLLLVLPALSLPTTPHALLSLPIVPHTPPSDPSGSPRFANLTTYERARLAQMKSYVPTHPGAPVARAATPKTIAGINYQFVQYVVVVGVGNPATTYRLVVDTGSSNTFVGTGKQYVKTATSYTTGQNVSVTYGSGYFSGQEYLDSVTLGAGLVLTNQSIGDATRYADFPGVDGLLGVGPAGLTRGTLSPARNTIIPTVVDTAYTQQLIPDRVLGIAFAPTQASSSANGALTFGGVEGRYQAGIVYTPVTTTYPSAYYWGINVTSLDFGGTNLFTNDAGIVDTGTTLIYIADDYFDKYQAAIPGSSLDSATGLLKVPSSQISTLPPLDFLIGGKTFTLSPEAQIVPQSEVAGFGGQTGNYYSYVGPMGNPSGQGFDFVLGQKFLERFYSVYDTTRSRVGLAYTEYTFSSYP